MNVAGYREALKAAQQVEVAADFVIRVASLPGLAILKLFAWMDRGADNRKDALDLMILLREYGAAGNEERLYGEEISLLQTVGYKLELASPRLLGRDAGLIITTETRGQILTLLDDMDIGNALSEIWLESVAAPMIRLTRQKFSSGSSKSGCRKLPVKTSRERSRSPIAFSEFPKNCGIPHIARDSRQQARITFSFRAARWVQVMERSVSRMGGVRSLITGD